MNGIDELDYYDLLEIPKGATPAEIERAHRLSLQTFGETSLALYSVFESSDAEAIRDGIDEAYRVLSDPESRAVYDENLSASEASVVPTALCVERNDEPQRGSLIEEAATAGAVDEVAENYDAFEDADEGDFDGVRLRRTRLFRGYEIEHISDVTKVSGTHLRNIEDENFADLPADVYVRGFVTAYAKTIGLDPQNVVPSYMTRVQESRSGNQRGRFLGRR